MLYLILVGQVLNLVDCPFEPWVNALKSTGRRLILSLNPLRASPNHGNTNLHYTQEWGQSQSNGYLVTVASTLVIFHFFIDHHK